MIKYWVIWLVGSAVSAGLVGPTRIAVYENDPADLECSSNTGPITACEFEVNGLAPVKIFNEMTLMVKSHSEPARFSTWHNFESGKCGMCIYSTKHSHAGLVSCKVVDSRNVSTIKNATLQVTTNTVKLWASSVYYEFMENDTMTFTCSVVYPTNAVCSVRSLKPSDHYGNMVYMSFDGVVVAKARNYVAWSKTAMHVDHLKRVKCGLLNTDIEISASRTVDVKYAPAIFVENQGANDLEFVVQDEDSFEIMVMSNPGVESWNATRFTVDWRHETIEPPSLTLLKFNLTCSIFKLDVSKNTLNNFKITFHASNKHGLAKVSVIVVGRRSSRLDLYTMVTMTAMYVLFLGWTVSKIWVDRRFRNPSTRRLGSVEL